MTTFEILDELKALDELLVEINEETGEVIDNSDLLKEELERLNKTKEEKLEALEYLRRDKVAKADTLKAEIKRLQDRVKMFNREAERVKELEDMLLGGEKLKTDKFTFSYRTTKQVVVDNEECLLQDDSFVRIKRELDKKAIKEHIEELEKAGLAHIEEKKSLSVR